VRRHRADDDEDDDGRVADPLPVAGGEVAAVVIDEEGPGEHQERHQQASQRALREARRELLAEADGLPGVAAGLEQLAGEPGTAARRGRHSPRGYPAATVA